MFVFRSGFPDICFNNETSLAHILLAGLQAFEYLDICSVTFAKFNGAHFVNIALPNEHHFGVIHTLHSFFSDSQRHLLLRDLDSAFHSHARSPFPLPIWD